ncbi:hypothetical protein ACRBDM_22350 [Vibrio parahaemolyticus]
MVGRSYAYRQGFYSKYCDNPFEMGSQEYNDFERGWSQKAKQFPNAVESKYKHKRFEPLSLNLKLRNRKVTTHMQKQKVNDSGYAHNKAFKRDSQRLAVLVQSLAFVFMAQ